MHKVLLTSIAFLLCHAALSAQIGGLNTFEFLNLSPSARITALGGNLITVRDDDAAFAAINPASLNAATHGQLSFNHSFHVAGISHGYASYARHFEEPQLSTHLGVQYVSYGEFDQTNVLGQVEGSFKAAEYAITLGAAREVYDRLSVGANLKFITSQLESYNSLGLAADLSAMYFDTARQVVFTLVAKNMGAQLTTYEDAGQEGLPFELQAGISKRLRYLPFRFSVVYRYLNQWNILYDDPNAESSTLFFGETEAEDSRASIWFDNFSRHFIFSGEFLIGKRDNFRLRVGYSHLRRQELSVDGFGSLAGFSLGAGIKVSRFRLEYGLASYHLGGSQNHISVSTNLSEFRKG